MINKISRMLKNRKGFTLVELMVVVVIIGVLTAIAVPVYQNVVANAETNAINANIRILDSAVSMYSVQNQVTDLSGVDITSAEGKAGGTDISPYLQEWPSGPGTTEYKVVDGKAAVE